MKTGLRIIKNSIVLIGGETYGVIINLLAIAIIARYLSLEVFGDYGFILAICVIFKVITDFGTSQIAIREIARDKVRAEKIFSACFILKIFLAVISFVIISLSIHLLSNSQQVIYATYICALAVIIGMIGDAFEVVFKGYERMEFNSIIKIIERTTYILGIVAVVTLDIGLYGIFFALLFTNTIRILAGFTFVSMRFFTPSIKWDTSTIRWIFKEAFPIGINRVLRKTSTRIDVILLKILRTSGEVGLFHGIYRIVMVASFVPRNITDSLFPVLSRYADGRGDSMAIVFEKSFKFLLVLVLPLIFIVYLGADQIVPLILGDNFSQATPLMQLLTLVWGVMFFSILCNKTLNASNHQKFATLATGICLSVNVVMDLILIPFFGYMGAGMATLTGEIVLLVVSFGFVSRHVCTISLGKVVLRPLIASLIAAGTGFILGSGLPLFIILISVTVYFVLLFFLRVFDDGELDIMKEVLHKVRNKFQKITLFGA